MKLYILLFSIIAALLFGCGNSHYILKSEAPPNLIGFCGFRWTTPMSTVNEKFARDITVKPISNLNNYFTSAFSNIMFFKRRANVCKFLFNPNGLHTVILFFHSEDLNDEDEFNIFYKKLSAIYGNSQIMGELATSIDYPNYIKGYIWRNCKLELILTKDHGIAVIASSNGRCESTIPVVY